MHTFRRDAITLIALLVPLLGSELARAADAKNVVIITFDGFRWQEMFGGLDERKLTQDPKVTENPEELKRKYWADTPQKRRELLLPFIWGTIAKEGQILGDAESGSFVRVTNGKNFSYPGYNEILTGAPDPRIDSNKKNPDPNVTILEWLNTQRGFQGKTAAFTSWDVFPYILNAERSKVPVNAGWTPFTESTSKKRLELINDIAASTPHVWGNVRFDVFTYQGASEYVKKHKPRALFVSFGETDDWAHHAQYDRYIESARYTDDFIRNLWTMMQSMSQYKNKTAFIIATDHGRGDLVKWTSHGAEVEGSDRIWMAAMGAGIAPKGVVKNLNATQSQISPSAAALLGFDFKQCNPNAAVPIDFK